MSFNLLIYNAFISWGHDICGIGGPLDSPNFCCIYTIWVCGSCFLHRDPRVFTSNKSWFFLRLGWLSTSDWVPFVPIRLTYCRWKKSQTTTCDVWNPVNNGINYQLPFNWCRISSINSISLKDLAQLVKQVWKVEIRDLKLLSSFFCGNSVYLYIYIHIRSTPTQDSSGK